MLRAGTADAETMVGQLGHLLTVGSLPSVSLGIIPFGHSRVLRPVEGFWIFDEDRVTVELVSGWLTITQPSEIAMYAQACSTTMSRPTCGHPGTSPGYIPSTASRSRSCPARHCRSGPADLLDAGKFERDEAGTVRLALPEALPERKAAR